MFKFISIALTAALGLSAPVLAVPDIRGVFGATWGMKQNQWDKAFKKSGMVCNPECTIKVEYTELDVSPIADEKGLLSKVYLIDLEDYGSTFDNLRAYLTGKYGQPGVDNSISTTELIWILPSTKISSKHWELRNLGGKTNITPFTILSYERNSNNGL